MASIVSSSVHGNSFKGIGKHTDHKLYLIICVMLNIEVIKDFVARSVGISKFR